MTPRTERPRRARPPDADPLPSILRQAEDRATDMAVLTWLTAMRERGEGGEVKRTRTTATADGNATLN